GQLHLLWNYPTEQEFSHTICSSFTLGVDRDKIKPDITASAQSVTPIKKAKR
ncbi:unnamed protein product, partial [marine sediment metagenome]